MKKTIMKRSLILTFIIIILSVNSVFGQAVIDTRSIEEGIISVKHDNVSANRMRILIEKDENRYTYNLNNEKENFSLQMGNGNYNISVLENTEGNRYRVVHNETVVASMKNVNTAFLGSVQMIKWDTSMKAIKKAEELVQDAKNDEEKVKKIYEYIISNVEYDFDKARNVTTGYLPEIDSIFAENKGICFDYASLYAAMLRSVGIPTKLVMGYAPDVKEYHAWNEVYIESKGQWVTMDTTVDAQYKKTNQTVDMFKNSSLYNKVYEY